MTGFLGMSVTISSGSFASYKYAPATTCVGSCLLTDSALSVSISVSTPKFGAGSAYSSYGFYVGTSLSSSGLTSFGYTYRSGGVIFAPWQASRPRFTPITANAVGSSPSFPTTGVVP